MLVKVASILLLTWILASPSAARDSAQPDSAVPPVRYAPITAGTKSYRPVEPLPWGQVNRRVMPKDAQPPASEAQPVPRNGPAGPGPQPPQRPQ